MGNKGTTLSDFLETSKQAACYRSL